jgi:hypothetical protein
MKKVTNLEWILIYNYDDISKDLPILDTQKNLSSLLAFEDTLEHGEIIEIHGLFYKVIHGNYYIRYEAI